MSQRALRSWWSIPFLLLPLAGAGCGGSDKAVINDPPDLGAGADGGGSDASAGNQLTETALTVSLEFVAPTGAVDGGAPATEQLRITTRDGVTAVRTDVWLYTLVGGKLQPLETFSAVIGRKTSHLMMPATIGGSPSGLVPADDGHANGLMTDSTRGSLIQGAFVPAIDGTIVVTFPTAPTDPIVVVAGIEDQRYAGAAAILPDGTAGTVPTGLGQPETHDRVSYEHDVAPILKKQCVDACHDSAGPFDAPLYLMDTQDHLVNDNFALSEQTEDCKAKYPNDPTKLASCIHDITQAQYLVEPGAPSLSDLLQRARPDESAGTSPTGLLWYGGGNPKARYNAGYGDRRMPSTTTSLTTTDWTNQPTYFDTAPKDFQKLYDWVAQGALP
jgi:hypothetical protein